MAVYDVTGGHIPLNGSWGTGIVLSAVTSFQAGGGWVAMCAAASTPTELRDGNLVPIGQTVTFAAGDTVYLRSGYPGAYASTTKVA
jgi:hypothetical protein